MRTRISVFLITLSGLILEVGLTRIYSAVWYRVCRYLGGFAGMGAGWFYGSSAEESSAVTMNAAALTTLLYAGAVPRLWLLVRYPFDMDRLPLYFLAPLAPFLSRGDGAVDCVDIHRAVAGTLYF
jgi:hypothetical protein